MTRVAVSLFVVAILSGLSSAVAAQANEDPSRLFPREAEIRHAGPPGLVRLPLPAEVLEASRPDLSDVRVHRGDGTEVAYAVQSGVPSDATELVVVPTSAERRVVRADSLRSHSVEVFELALPMLETPAGRHTLYFGSVLPDFVRQVTVRAPDGETLAEGTIFRMPSPRRERLFVELPPTGERITVEVAGEGGYLEPTFRIAATRAPIDPVTFARALEPSAVRHADGRTVIDVVRPVGMTPDTLRIVTEVGTFAREVRVFDVRGDEGAVAIGRSMLFRVAELSFENTGVPLRPARGERLRIEIDNGDEGPLDARFEVVVQQPSLLFRAGAGPHRLRFGGGRARPPSYELRRIMASAGAHRRIRVLDLPTAELGALADNPAFDDAPALQSVMRPGRELERSAFTHQATLRVQGASEGLSRVRIPPSVQALAREDLGDIRIVDDEGRQRPYLVARRQLADPVEARVERRTDGDESRYRIEPVSGRARVQRLRFQPDAAYVARSYTLHGIAEDGTATELDRGMLSRDPDDPRPLRVSVPPTWVNALELVVHDGNDAPLSLSETVVEVVSPTLSLAAPDGTYRVLVGNPDAAPPTYELANAPAWLLDVQAGEGTVSEPTPNPEHVEPDWTESVDAQAIALWGALLLALLVLGALTVRMAGAAPDAPSESPPDGEPGAGAGTDSESSGSGEEGGASADPAEPPADTRPSRF